MLSTISSRQTKLEVSKNQQVQGKSSFWEAIEDHASFNFSLIITVQKYSHLVLKLTFPAKKKYYVHSYNVKTITYVMHVKWPDLVLTRQKSLNL